MYISFSCENGRTLLHMLGRACVERSLTCLRPLHPPTPKPNPLRQARPMSQPPVTVVFLTIGFAIAMIRRWPTAFTSVSDAQRHTREALKAMQHWSICNF